MIYVISLVSLVAMLFILHRRKKQKTAMKRRSYESIRVFEPGIDPFDYNNRIEFHVRRRED